MSSPSMHPRDTLLKTAKEQGLSFDDVKFANFLDSRDPLRHFRDEFPHPTLGKLLEDDLEEGWNSTEAAYDPCFALY